MHPLNPLYELVARGIVTFHHVFAPVFGTNSFMSYALSIALIVVIVRLLIFPLFKRSVKAQRTMQQIQPQMKEIREKYKNDRQTMNAKIMELQKEHGNPLMGCLPLVLQIPLFVSLFHVFNKLAPRPGGEGVKLYGTSGLTRHEVQQIAQAKLGGVSLASAFTSSANSLHLLGANGTAVRIVAAVLIVVMGLTTFVTQKQIMGRSGPMDPQQQKIQRIFLYVSPFMLAVFGFRFPIAVLIYWLTTNLWSMAQQAFIIRTMGPPPGAPGAAVPGKGPVALAKGKAGEAAPAPAAPARLTQVRVTPAEPGPRMVTRSPSRPAGRPSSGGGGGARPATARRKRKR